MPIDDPCTTDDDSTINDEMVLAKARFHRVLLETLEKRMKEERKQARLKKLESKKARKEELLESLEKRLRKERKEKRKEKKEKEDTKKTQETKKKDEKKRRKVKKEKVKDKTKTTDNEKVKKEKVKTKKDDKTKKKKKKVKKKRDSKTQKSITVDVSDDDSTGSFKYWWSVGVDAQETKRQEARRQAASKRRETNSMTQIEIINQIPAIKKKSCLKRHSDPAELTSITEHTAQSSLGSSQNNWSFNSNIIRKVDSAEDYSNKNPTPMWWDMAEEKSPKTPTMAHTKKVQIPQSFFSPRSESSLPTSLLSPRIESSENSGSSEYTEVTIEDDEEEVSPPTMAPRNVNLRDVALLLSPRDDTSESDYDEVSIFSEESLSEEILEDLSCILDMEDDGDYDYEGTIALSKTGLLDDSLTDGAYDTSSICSGPFNPFRKNTAETPTGEDSCESPSNQRKVLPNPRDQSSGDSACEEDQCKTPLTRPRHLSNVKVLASRDSPYEKDASPNPSATPTASNTTSSSCPSSRSDSQKLSSPKLSSPKIAERIQNMFGGKKRVPLHEEPAVDGITPVPIDGLFAKKKMQVPELPIAGPLD